MVGEREFVASRLDRGVVERAAAHLGAKAARRGLLAPLEDDLGDVRLDDGQRNADVIAPVAKRFDLGGVGVLEAHIDVDRAQFEFFGREFFVRGEHGEQSRAVLAAAYADGDAVAVGDHFVVVDRLARERE